MCTFTIKKVEFFSSLVISFYEALYFSMMVLFCQIPVLLWFTLQLKFLFTKMPVHVTWDLEMVSLVFVRVHCRLDLLCYCWASKQVFSVELTATGVT